MYRYPSLYRQEWAANYIEDNISHPNDDAMLLMNTPFYFQACLQLLMQPPQAHVSCRCSLYGLELVYLQQKTHGPSKNHKTKTADMRELAHFTVSYNQMASQSYDSHLCPGHILDLMSGPLCRPWFRAGWILYQNNMTSSAILPYYDNQQHKYSLMRFGRVVAIAHFLILLYWSGISTCSILRISDHILHWFASSGNTHKPTEKQLRGYFGDHVSKMNINKTTNIPNHLYQCWRSLTEKVEPITQDMQSLSAFYDCLHLHLVYE
jgi:hypothetical protein